MKIIITITLTLSTACLFGQAPTFEWAKQLGGVGGAQSGLSVTVDDLGNVYTAGRFGGVVDFDPGPGVFNLTSTGGWDTFISKLDAQGNFIWAKTFGGTGSDHSHSIDVDALGNVYTTGRFEETVDFDPGPGTHNLTSTGGRNVFVSKLDTDGNFIWAKTFSGAQGWGRSIKIDVYGNVFTTGRFAQTVDFDPAPTETFNLTANSWDIFISKLDTDGNFIWAKAFGGIYLDEGFSIAVNDAGEVYTTGRFENDVDFDPGPDIFQISSMWGQDVFISKLDADGNFIWAKAFGGAFIDNGISIASDNYGNVYTTGFFNETVDFDPGPENYYLTGEWDVFISKIDADGNFIWAKAFGGTGQDEPGSIGIDILGNVYTTGYFQETVDFDPGPNISNQTASGGFDIFISKLDIDGNFVWAGKLGGGGTNTSHSIKLGMEGHIYTTGTYTETVDFDPGADVYNLTSFGGLDIFVHKMSQCLFETNINNGESLEICREESLSLMVNTGINYLWNTGDTSASVLVTPESTTNYSVTVIDANDCSDSDTVTVIVNDLPNIVISGDLEICEGESTDLTVSGEGNYLWSTGSDSNEIHVSPITTSIYIVTVTNENDCSSVDSVSVIIDNSLCPPCPTFGIPNVFTPNGDQDNDSFYIFSDGEFEIVDFKIFSRWGNLVHNSADPWDGTFKDEPVPSDVYIYMITVTTDCETKHFRGELTLLR